MPSPVTAVIGAGGGATGDSVFLLVLRLKMEEVEEMSEISVDVWKTYRTREDELLNLPLAFKHQRRCTEGANSQPALAYPANMGPPEYQGVYHPLIT